MRLSECINDKVIKLGASLVETICIQNLNIISSSELAPDSCQTVALKLYGNSEIGVHVRNNLCYLICVKTFG